MLYEISEDERMFQVTKSYLHHEMDRGGGCKKSCVYEI